jgi:excisionase family DNA binding protein
MHAFGGQKEKESVPLSERLSYSPSEASAVSGVGETAIREAAASGALEAHKHGRRPIIMRDDLCAWLKALPKASQQAAE